MILIDWITELINNIPTLLDYIVLGYIFLSAYYWTSFIKFENSKIFIVKSIVISYILKNFYKATILCLVPKKLITSIHITILLYIITLILGLGLGRIFHTVWFGDLLIKLNLGRTLNSNIWDDIFKSGMILRIYMKDGSSYIGQYCKSEEHTREPLILLTNYQKWNKNDEIVLDYFDDKDRFVLLNTKDFESIRIDYSHCNDEKERKMKK